MRLPDQPGPSLASQQNDPTQPSYENVSNDLEMNIGAFVGQEQDFDALYACVGGVG